MDLYADDALLPSGWARGVRLGIGADGMLTNVAVNASAEGAERAGGPVVPGMPNLHSHAFQRSLAGRTGRRSSGAAGESDSFWTWREAMYAFLDRIDAEAFGAIAAQAYVEMLRAGYTSVAEFHYVHRDPLGKHYAERAELSLRIAAAAAETGIGLTLLPVFYAHGGFGGAAPTPGQRRFVHSLDAFSALIADLGAAAQRRDYTLGIAAHRLRAVTADELAAIGSMLPTPAPLHIHAAEQMREVHDCVAATGQRPVQWLLDHADIDARWCLVHATHMTADETARLAKSGAVAGLAPTTEADLGDGTFAALPFLAAGGIFGIGSDSNTGIDPYAELRQLEYSQRLLHAARNVLARDDRPVGHALYAAAASGGAQSLGQPVGAIAAGRRADLVVLDTADPALAGIAVEHALDAAIFGPCRGPVRDVMVKGQWVVRDGRHARQDATLAAYRATLSRLLSAA